MSNAINMKEYYIKEITNAYRRTSNFLSFLLCCCLKYSGKNKDLTTDNCHNCMKIIAVPVE